MLEETRMYDDLRALRGLGLGDASYDDVDARCRAALRREMDRERHPSRRPWWRRIRLRVAVPLAAVLIGCVGAVGYATLSSPAQLSAGIQCHEDTRLDGSSAIVSVDGGRATQTCARLWASAQLDPRAHAAPAPLHACVDPDGGQAIHVFASADSGVCARAGLREDRNAGADPAARQYGSFSRDLLAKLNRVDCPTDAQARTMVRESLQSAGLTGWIIEDHGGYSAGRPCASLALDSDARVATISAIGN